MDQVSSEKIPRVFELDDKFGFGQDIIARILDLHGYYCGKILVHTLHPIPMIS